MSETEKQKDSPARSPLRLYILVAALLVVIIIVAAVLIITKGLPALRGSEEPTVVAGGEPSATPVPTFTPAPTRPPTDTPPPTPTPTLAVPAMLDTDTPAFEMQSAGGRPSTEWTGFFGQVLDSQGKPLAGIPLIVWYPDPQGIPAEPVDHPGSPIVLTDQEGNYEIRLAEAPYAGIWSIQVLTLDGQPASKLLTFQTADNAQTGIQQIQVIWRQVP